MLFLPLSFGTKHFLYLFSRVCAIHEPSETKKTSDKEEEATTVFTTPSPNDGKRIYEASLHHGEQAS